MYRWLIRPLLYLLPAEFAHHLAFGFLRFFAAIPGGKAILRFFFAEPSPELRIQALGRTFENPFGLAAGFDKNAVGFEALHALGFGFIEVGTLTGQAQPGNPKPRLFRLKQDRALLNRMGFNNDGAEAAKPRLAKPRTALVGINIGKTKIVEEEHALSDYIRSTKLLAPHADYLVVNVSSPNTPGLRNLQSTEKLKPLLEGVRRTANEVRPNTHVPLLVKIAPDLADEDVDDIARLCLELKLDGIIATNTTIARQGLNTPSEKVQSFGAGGISGAPVQRRSLQVLKRLKHIVGNQLVLISVGGIETADDAWQRIQSGATLLQGYTPFIYKGPSYPKRILKGLQRHVRNAGYGSLQEATDTLHKTET